MTVALGWHTRGTQVAAPALRSDCVAAWNCAAAGSRWVAGGATPPARVGVTQLPWTVWGLRARTTRVPTITSARTPSAGPHEQGTTRVTTRGAACSQSSMYALSETCRHRNALEASQGIACIQRGRAYRAGISSRGSAPLVDCHAVARCHQSNPCQTGRGRVGQALEMSAFWALSSAIRRSRWASDALCPTANLNKELHPSMVLCRLNSLTHDKG